MRSSMKTAASSTIQPFRGANSPLRLLRLVRIVEEKLVAVEILDHDQPVAPVAVLNGNAAGFELGAQRVQRRNLGVVRLGLNVQGNEHQTLADLLRPLL
jgi:hypothetical protein